MKHTQETDQHRFASGTPYMVITEPGPDVITSEGTYQKANSDPERKLYHTQSQLLVISLMMEQPSCFYSSIMAEGGQPRLTFAIEVSLKSHD